MPRGSKKPITDILQNGAWAGQQAFILGGGPSLRGFDFERLRGQRTIVVNLAFLVAPFADLMFSMDYSFYRKLRIGGFGEITTRRFQEFHGVRCWLELDNHDYPAPIYYVRGHLSNKGLPAKFEQGFWTGANSGFGALMMAVCLKANPINLLGYDFKYGPDGRGHFHNLYKAKPSPQQLSRFRKPFEMMAGPLAEKGIRVYNLNPDSGLRCFPFRTIDEALFDQNSKPDASPLEDPVKADLGLSCFPNRDLNCFPFQAKTASHFEAGKEALDGQTNDAPAAEPDTPAPSPDPILADEGGALRAGDGPEPGPGLEPEPPGGPPSHSGGGPEPGPSI